MMDNQNGIVAKNLPRQTDENLASPPGDPGLSGDSSNENVERIYLAGVQMLYDDKAHAMTLEQLKAGAADPGEAIANITFGLMTSLDDKSGNKLPEDAIIPAALKLLEEVATLAEKSGATPFDENTMAQAAQSLIAMAIEKGIIDPAEIEQMMAEMDPQEVQQMVAQQEQIASAGRQDPQQEQTAATGQQEVPVG